MTTGTFGALLRRWRRVRQRTQQDLAADAEVSTRHLSFLENGRAMPSREMVLVLASALEVPLRARNTLLASAGFGPAYRETDLSDPDLAPVSRVVDWMLARHEPYPAFAVDRLWRVLRTNHAARRIAAALGQDLPANALAWTFDPSGLQPLVENWPEYAGTMLRRVARDAAGDRDVADLLDSLLAFGTAPRGWARSLHDPPSVLVPLVLGVAGVRLSLFTTITTIGTPQDITLAELRIETILPADSETEAALQALA
jgi:transcriptional regulator with XRE-family HTH domain